MILSDLQIWEDGEKERRGQSAAEHEGEEAGSDDKEIGVNAGEEPVTETYSVARGKGWQRSSSNRIREEEIWEEETKEKIVIPPIF